MRTRRKITAFSLSFLDIMSCGFGAVVLLFLIIKHNVDANVPDRKIIPDLNKFVQKKSNLSTSHQKMAFGSI